MNKEDKYKTHWLYIAESDSGLFKLGITTVPQKKYLRMAQIFKQRQMRMKRMFFFPSIGYAHDVELKLVHQIAKLPGVRQYRREWFWGVDYDRVKEMAFAAVMAERSRIQTLEMSASEEVRKVLQNLLRVKSKREPA